MSAIAIKRRLRTLELRKRVRLPATALTVIAATKADSSHNDRCRIARCHA